VGLTPLEFDLLVALARKPSRVVSREELLEEVWGYRHAADTRLVNVHIQRLRAKIEEDQENPKMINSINHNGRIDLGLGSFFTRRFSSWGYLKTGFCATLPVGGDRYEWSADSIDGLDESDVLFFNKKGTEAYKQLNLVFAIPIILEISLK
jgi:hypothetical protein